ncbi:MAG: protein kinase [Oligoflexia bacterium]|nr:protein kinase [Oligoflexia bacterium]
MDLKSIRIILVIFSFVIVQIVLFQESGYTVCTGLKSTQLQIKLSGQLPNQLTDQLTDQLTIPNPIGVDSKCNLKSSKNIFKNIFNLNNLKGIFRIGSHSSSVQKKILSEEQNMLKTVVAAEEAFPSSFTCREVRNIFEKINLKRRSKEFQKLKDIKSRKNCLSESYDGHNVILNNNNQVFVELNISAGAGSVKNVSKAIKVDFENKTDGVPAFDEYVIYRANSGNKSKTMNKTYEKEARIKKIFQNNNSAVFSTSECHNMKGVKTELMAKFYKNRDAFEFAKTKDYQLLLQSEQGRKLFLKNAIELVKLIKQMFENNLSHRDIKPENLFVDANVNLALGDFDFLTYLKDLKISGTPGFIAPEFFYPFYKNKGVENADLYSLGVTLYELFNPDFYFLSSNGSELVDVGRSAIKEYMRNKIDFAINESEDNNEMINVYKKELQRVEMIQNPINKKINKIFLQMSNPNPKERSSVEDVIRDLKSIYDDLNKQDV